MKQRIALYCRVSSADQTIENQQQQLQAWAERAGLQDNVVTCYEDEAVSGKRQRRPGLAKLEKAIAARRVNTVAVVALDRLGRSLQHLTALLAEWNALDCQLVTLREGVDTNTPAGRALLQMAGVFAEFEHALIVERTKAGLARARAQGKRIGRPPVAASIQRRAARLLQEGQSQRAVRRICSLSGSTVANIHKRLKVEGTLPT